MVFPGLSLHSYNDVMFEHTPWTDRFRFVDSIVSMPPPDGLYCNNSPAQPVETHISSPCFIPAGTVILIDDVFLPSAPFPTTDALAS